MRIRHVISEGLGQPRPPFWRDLADVVSQTNPDATPARGMCFISDDNLWTVARVDIRDPAKGWAVWMGQRRVGEHILLRDEDVAKVFARLAMVPVRGISRVLRSIGLMRATALALMGVAARIAAPWAADETDDRDHADGSEVDA